MPIHGLFLCTDELAVAAQTPPDPTCSRSWCPNTFFFLRTVVGSGMSWYMFRVVSVWLLPFHLPRCRRPKPEDAPADARMIRMIIYAGQPYPPSLFVPHTAPCSPFFFSSFFFLIFRRMGKNRSLSKLPHFHVSDTCRVSILPDAPVAIAARAKDTERVSMSTRPDPERSGAVEIAARRPLC